ncbi:MAG: hypothetical protein AAFW75_29005, partial [Cyanobacteria bacterium J06636_16]
AVAAGATGTGGNIVINSRSLEVSNGTGIAAGTFGVGSSGNIAITADDAVIVDGTTSNTGGETGTPSFISTSVLSGATGAGGNIEIDSGSLQIKGGATLRSGTFGAGNSGNIEIAAEEAIVVRGTGNTEDVRSLITSTVTEGSTGEGGNINMVSRSLQILEGGTLFAGTNSVGNSGDITITVEDTVIVAGVSEDAQFSSLITSLVSLEGLGKGGDIEIAARAVQILGEAETSPQPGLFASSLGEGNSGNILVDARDELNLSDGQINTLSLGSSGGTITVNAEQIQLAGDGDILTLVSTGEGRGGDITLSAEDFILALDDSDILAAAPEGRGGDVVLQTPGFFGENFTPASLVADPDTLDNNDRVDINATGAVSGVVTLPDISFIESSLNSLPDAIVASDQLLVGSCIARADNEQGSFVVTGGGGLSARPGDMTTATFQTGAVRGTSDRAESEAAEPSQSNNPIAEPTGIYELADGRVVLSHRCDREEGGEELGEWGSDGVMG